MPLVLEIEHLLGVAFAAVGPDTGEPDWPPQPDRVFSALVASWAARGQRPEERAALEWLEAQEPPRIAASGVNVRPAPTVFVPPNDPQTGRVGDRTVMPAMRRRQARRFPAALPDDPTVRMVWTEAADPPLAALNALARDTAYVGHSTSLTRCHFKADADRVMETLGHARRRVYPGRLKELEAAFAAKRRPSPGQSMRSAVEPATFPQSDFSDDWLTFAINEATPADIRIAPLAAKALVKAVMSGWRQAGLGEVPPTWIAGHEADGAPARVPHLAAAPLAFVGWPHADGGLKGLALIPPRGIDLRAQPGLVAAIKAIAPLVDGERTIDLWSEAVGSETLRLKLKLIGAGAEVTASLAPGRYGRSARVWATATPLVLDRHLKSPGKARGDNEALQAEIEALVAEACANIGLPKPVRIATDKHSAIQGAVSARSSGRNPSWMRWRLPEALKSRPLTHAVIDFGERVRGPVILGAGRFCGLGLCLPLDRPPSGQRGRR